MKTLDDAWNAQDWETFSQRHMDDVIVRWPNKIGRASCRERV